MTDRHEERAKTRRQCSPAAEILFAGIVLLVAGCSNDSSTDAAPGQPMFKNIVIIVVDTLRPDRLGAFGYARDTSPNIDRFAQDAAIFEQAFSVSPWTRTSVVSMFTSMYPVAHACQDTNDSADDKLVMMAEIFKANGFSTGGFSTNISVSEKFNVAQGFDEFVYFERQPWFADHPGRPDPGYVPIEGMMADAFEWLLDVGDEPFFFYFHSTDPHWQYRPPAEFVLWGDQRLGDLYDAEIRYTDFYFQEIIDHLTRLGKIDDTLIIFTADHGEELFEHGGHGHGHTLYNELLRVPLILRHPGLQPRRVTETVRLIDILPTVIDLFDLESNGAMIQGRSLLPMLFGDIDPQPDEQFVLGEVMYPSKIEGISLEADDWKLIRVVDMQPNRGFPRGKRNTWELYNLATDPGELVNVVRFNPAVLESTRKRMESLREKFDASGLEGKDTDIDEATREALRSLGYVE
jgi:arylsulfatase A-like enzyme